jgi:DNA-binding response OmpR family regulator
VEDDVTIGGLLAETLEDLGHAVCAVETNVAKAVAAALRWRPDLMIVDVGLGGASGVAAVKAILRGGFVPHVFVTGEALSGISLGRGAVLIRKPFRVSDLDQAIQRAFAAAASLDREVCVDRPPEMAQQTQLAAITPTSRELPRPRQL